MSYNTNCKWFSMEYVGNPGAVPACNRDAVLEAFDCSTCKENQINANPTNADRIRAMTDEELADWYFNEFFKKTPYCIIPDCTEKNRCEDCLIAWLKKEAEP